MTATPSSPVLTSGGKADLGRDASAQANIISLGAATNLSDNTRRWIVDGLVAELPNHQIEHYFRTKPYILANSDYVTVASASRTGRCLGLIAVSHRQASSGQTFTYIETLLVGESKHRAGVAMQLIAEAFRQVSVDQQGFPDLVAMKTYNPRTYQMMRRFGACEGAVFFPQIGGSDSEDTKRMATSIASALISEIERFDSDTGIVHGGAVSIGAEFWPSFPACTEPAVNAHFVELMTPDDRLFCLLIAQTHIAKRSVLTALGIGDLVLPSQKI
jgi:hypothetical protein